MPHYHSTGAVEVLAIVFILTLLIGVGMMRAIVHDFTLPRFLSRFVRASEDRYIYNHLD